MSEPLFQPRNDFSARLLGTAFASCGAALLWWQIVGTLREARAGAATLSYSITLLLLGAAFVAMGLLWIARGLAGYQLVRSLQHEPKVRKWFMICAAVLGALTLALLRWHLERLGYSG